MKNMILSLLTVSYNIATNELTDEETAQIQLVSGRTRFQKRGKTRSSNERSFFPSSFPWSIGEIAIYLEIKALARVINYDQKIRYL